MSDHRGNETEAGYTDLAQISTPDSPSSGYDRLYFKNDDILYRKTPSGTETPVGGSGSGLVLISDTLLGSAGTFDISSISGSYKGLLVIGASLRADSSADQAIDFRFNNDSGTNYTELRNYTDSTPSNVTAGADSQTQMNLASVPGTARTSGYNAMFRMLIEDYASTTFFKVVTLQGGGKTNVPFGFNSHGMWYSTAAITRVQVFPGGSANFLTGGRLTIWGIS